MLPICVALNPIGHTPTSAMLPGKNQPPLTLLQILCALAIEATPAFTVVLVPSTAETDEAPANTLWIAWGDPSLAAVPLANELPIIKVTPLPLLKPVATFAELIP